MATCFGKELFITFTVCFFLLHSLNCVYVSFTLGFEGDMMDLIV